MASLECEHDSEGCTGKGKLSPPHTHTPCPRVLAGSGRVQGLEPWTSWPQLMLQLDPSSCSSVDGRVRRYDLRLGQLFSDYVGSPITCTCFSRDGQCTLVSSLDSTLRLLDKDTGELLGEYTGHKNQEYKLDCCLSERDTHVVSCSEDGKVYFWDLVEGALTLALPVGPGVVQSLAFHPTEPCLLTATGGSVQCWREEAYEADGGTG